MREDIRSYSKYIFEEWALHSLAMNYQANGQVEEAMAILKLNTEMFPNSWETHQHFAEANLAIGNKELAIESYKKALNINPDATNIKKALEILRRE